MKTGTQVALLVITSFLALGLVNEHFTFQYLADKNSYSVKVDTANARKVFDEIQAVEVERKIAEVKAKCFTDKLAAALEVKDPEERHFAVFKEAHVLAQVTVKADLFIVLDDKGIAVARNIDAKFQGMDLSEKPLVKEALQGRAGVAIWNFNDEYQLVSVVPFKSKDKVKAVLVVGNAMGMKTAKDSVKLLGGEFFLLHKRKILASSMSENNTRAMESFIRQNMEKILPVFEGEEGINLEPMMVKLPAGEYWAVFSDFNRAVGGEKVAYAMLRSVTMANMPLNSARSTFYLIGGALLVVFLIWGALISRAARKPLDAVFEGAQEIIHGNKDYQWDQEAPGDLGAVGGSLNAMVAVLLGKELPDEDESTESWENALLQDVVEPDTGTQEATADRSETARAASEDLETGPSEGDDYYDKLYSDFIKARRECNESVQGITKEKFIAKVKTNEKLLAQKHNYELVRFEVYISNGKAALRALPVKKAE